MNTHLPDHQNSALWQMLLQPNKCQLRLNKLPAARGFEWLTLGIQTFRSQMLGLFALACAYQMASIILQLIPSIGVGLSLLCVPLLSLGYTLGTVAARAGMRVKFTLLFFPAVFGYRYEKPLLRSLLIVGAVYAVLCLALITWVQAGTSEGLAAFQALVEQTQKNQPSPQETLAMMTAFHTKHPEVARYFTSAMLGVCLLSLLFAHVPALCFWGKLNPVKAMVFNIMGLARNIGAYIVFVAAYSMLSLAALMCAAMILPLFLPLMLVLVFAVGMCAFTHAFVDTYCPTPAGTAATRTN